MMRLFPWWFKLPQGIRGGMLIFLGAVSISFGPIIITMVDAGATASAFYRMFFGGIVLLLAALLKRCPLRPSLPAFIAIILAGAAFCGDLFFWHRSILLVGPGLSTILANFQVFVLAIAGILFFGEKASIRVFGAIVLALIGLVMLLEVDLRSLPPGLFMGIVYGLVTSLFLSCYVLLLRHSRRVAVPLPLLANMAWVSFACAVFLATLLLLEGGSFALASASDAGFLILYGIGCQAIGWLMVSAGLPYLPPGKGGLLFMAEPLFAFVWDVLLLGRPTGIAGYGGALLTIFAIYLCFSGGRPKGKQGIA